MPFDFSSRLGTGEWMAGTCYFLGGNQENLVVIPLFEANYLRGTANITLVGYSFYHLLL